MRLALAVVVSALLSGCRPAPQHALAPPPAAAPSPAPPIEPQPSPPPAADAPADEPAPPTPTPEPPAPATEPHDPSVILTPVDLVADPRRWSGLTVTIRARPAYAGQGCTSSVPPHCWGTIELKDPAGPVKAYPVLLRGTYNGAAIVCSDTPASQAPRKRRPAKGAGLVGVAQLAGRCSPDLDSQRLYLFRGVITFTGGGFELQPTSITPSP